MGQTVSPTEAADLLNISEDHVHDLIRGGALRVKGARLERAEVIAYRDEKTQKRESALAEIVALGEEQNLPY